MKFPLSLLLIAAIVAQPALSKEYAEGELSAQQIMTFKKFAKHQEDVSYSSEQVAFLQAITTTTSVKIFFGQWCHDSQREVPRLIQLFSKANNPNIEVVYYGLNTSKTDEMGLAEANNIKKTPTIIIEQDGKELGRILEFPRIDWPTDLEEILSK